MESNTESSESTKTRILIVDDEESIRLLLRRALETTGEYEMCEAYDGVNAQEVLQHEPIDVVITDLRMPRMGGLALMRWAHEERLEATWILLSGQGTFDDAVLAVQLGAFDFLTKPLTVIDQLLVTVRNAVQQRALTSERERLYQTIAERNARLNMQVTQLKDACGLLLKQADTIEADLHRAELIQRALLPNAAPPLQGFAVDTIYRPCHSVGGDLYDIVRLDERTLIAYIADAAGHGVSAAMLAVLFKHRIPLTAGQPPTPTPPAQALEAVNRCLITECRRPGLFVTAAYCLLDTVTGEATIASAGHPPLILQRADGGIEKLHHTGPALGLSDDATFAQHTIRLAGGDRLLMYTDGLCDGRSMHDLFTNGDFGPILADRDLGSQSLLHALLNAAAQRRDGEAQSDDVTMLLLTTTAADSTLDNGAPEQGPPTQPIALGPAAEVLVGAEGDHFTFTVQGRGTWTHCSTLHDTCVEQLKAHHHVTLDLSLCEYLDSTFLGTIQEIVDIGDRAHTAVRIQGVLPGIREMFEELGMTRVIGEIAADMEPLPTHMAPVESNRTNDTHHRKRILMAHEALASLNVHNRDEFIRLIEGMQAELDRAESGV